MLSLMENGQAAIQVVVQLDPGLGVTLSGMRRDLQTVSIQRRVLSLLTVRVYLKQK